MIKKLQIGLTAVAAMALAGQAFAQSAAERAVEAAKEFAGTEITIVSEAGLQSLDPLNFSGPKWKELTGIDVKVIEVSTAEMFTKILQEHRAGTGAYDALNVIPSWMPDLARAGALEQADPVFYLTHGLTNGTKDVFINPPRYGEFTWFEYVKARFAGFSQEEVQAIHAYLVHQQGLAVTDNERLTIAEALENYWRRRVIDPDS